MRILKCLSLFVSVLFITSCGNNEGQKNTQPEKEKQEVLSADISNVEMSIEGMTCAVGCAAVIQKKLNATPGVASAKVSFEEGKAVIAYDASKVNTEDLSAVVTGIGETLYKVGEIKSIP